MNDGDAIARQEYAAPRRVVPFTPIILCVATLVLFTWLLSHPYFVDPDSFYHIGMSRLMMNEGWFVTSFPSLPLTTLRTTFADQAWLYHLLLIPFLTAFGNVVGMKVLAVLLATMVITSVFLIARRWRTPHAWLYPLVLLLTPAFLFRLALGKPSSIAVLIFIWGVYALIEKKYWWLLALSVAFTWTHGSWPLLLGASVLSALLQRTWRATLPAIAGTAAGLFVNPSFPANLAFFWQQTVLIGFLGFRETIGVGREWYPYSLADFIGDNALLCMLTALAMFLMMTRRDRTPATRTLFWSSAALFMLTLRANRNIEFLAPLLTLFSAYVLSVQKDFLMSFLPRFPYRRIIATALICLSLIAMLQLIQLKPLLARGYRHDAFADVSAWLKEHVAPGTLIVNTRWEDFPALWIRNPQLRFVIGLDPAFLYLENPETYRAWQRFIHGELSTDPLSVHTTLGSDVIVVKKEFLPLYRLLRASPVWTLAYEDREVWIFEESDSSVVPAAP